MQKQIRRILFVFIMLLWGWALSQSIENYQNSFRELIQNSDYSCELLLTHIAKENIKTINEMIDTDKTEEKLAFLRSVRLIRTEEKKRYELRVKDLVNSPDKEIRLEAVKTIHYLLSYEEETKIFSDYLNGEKSEEITKLICSYIGRIK